MGEIADMMLDGTLDSETGEYIGPPCGYPRSLVTEHDEKATTRARRTKLRRERRKRSKARKAEASS